MLAFLLLALELGVAQRALPRQPELRIWTIGTWMSSGVVAVDGGTVGRANGLMGSNASLGVERLYALADRALYRAKNRGRNRIETVAAEEAAEPAATFVRVAG